VFRVPGVLRGLHPAAGRRLRPPADLLEEALPYLDAYPNTAIVQTPQFFRIADGQSWVERGAGAVQELFYRSIQTARARKGGSICVGSCAVYRRTALQDNLRSARDFAREEWPPSGAVRLMS
jgi:cellulose synthase/poly-beta-1,6-N-acetylglucosamine synthase-like glycosyltransferase